MWQGERNAVLPNLHEGFPSEKGVPEMLCLYVMFLMADARI